MNCIQIDNDKECLELFTHLDTVIGFDKLYDFWKTEMSEDWYSKEIKQALDDCLTSINQLASYISSEHKNIDVQIDVSSIKSVKGRQFATIIKSTYEYKLLKQYIRKHDETQLFEQQSITVQILCRLIFNKIKKLLETL